VVREGILKDTRGLSFVEYLIVLCVIALLGFGAWRAFGEAISGEVMLASNDVAVISSSSGGSGGGGPGGSGGGAGGAAPSSTGGGTPAGGTSAALGHVALPEMPTALAQPGSDSSASDSLTSPTSPSGGPSAGAGDPSGGGASPSGGGGSDGSDTNIVSSALSTASNAVTQWADDRGGSVGGQIAAGVADIGAGLIQVGAMGSDLVDWAINSDSRWEDTQELAGKAWDGAVAVAKDPLPVLEAAWDQCTGSIRGGTQCASELIGGGALAVAKKAAKARRLAGDDGDTPDANPDSLGDGSFSVVRRDGDQVVKDIKSEVGRGDELYRLSDGDRAQLGDLTAEFSNDLRNADGIGDLVPETRVSAPGQLRSDYMEGYTSEQLRRMNADAFDSANTNANSLVTRAERHWDLDHGGSGELDGGWRVQVDDNMENFRFDADGNVTSWIDPVAVWPPKSRLVSGGE